MLSLGGPSVQVYNNLALALKDDGQLEAALAAFDRALALAPDYANGHFNRGNLLADAGRYEEAIDSYRRALALDPGDAGAHCRLGVACGHLGRADEALTAFERALAINPDYAEAHRNRAFVWLAQGRYRQGWQEFESRLACDDLPMPQVAGPRWDGSPLEGRRLLLYGEQGLGDTLQFVRYVPLVEQRGGQAVLGVPASLIPLLTVSGYGRWIVPRGSEATYDLHCPLLSFPYMFGGDDGQPLWRGPYLQPDAERLQRWREPLTAIEGFKVGIAWAGNPGYLHDQFRSVRLDELAPLARVPGVRLVSLQKGGGDDLRRVAGEIPIVDLGESFDAEGGAFMDTAAVVGHLDLVIAVNSSVAHLSGGLGAPVWMALQRSVDWRWPACDAKTPWYPSIAHFSSASTRRLAAGLRRDGRAAGSAGGRGFAARPVKPLHCASAANPRALAIEHRLDPRPFRFDNVRCRFFARPNPGETEHERTVVRDPRLTSARSPRVLGRHQLAVGGCRLVESRHGQDAQASGVR